MEGSPPMSSATLVSVQEYLATCYRPDRDYVDGEIQERNSGEQPHSLTQVNLTIFLGNRRTQWGIRVLTEQRVQVGPTRFRVPDVCVLPASASRDPIAREAPFLCIEILSPEDRVLRFNERVADYFQMGVRYVWLLDPLTKRAFCYTPGEMHEMVDRILRTKSPDIEVPLSEVFEAEN
jgi:Uma2 family endonuclease